VLAYARTGLPDEEFSAQTATLRSLLEFDGGARTWHARLSLDQPDRAVMVLNGLLAAAREHGTEVRVRFQPADVLPPVSG
jgi:hypothetical protein